MAHIGVRVFNRHREVIASQGKSSKSGSMHGTYDGSDFLKNACSLARYTGC